MSLTSFLQQRVISVSNIQRGLDVFGLTKIMRNFPILLHLLRPTSHKLTPKVLLNLLTPMFSEEGSNTLIREKQVYTLFIKYVREVGSGRRPVTLDSLLVFCTGASEEPILGFSIHPSINFVREEQPSEVSICTFSNIKLPIDIVSGMLHV